MPERRNALRGIANMPLQVHHKRGHDVPRATSPHEKAKSLAGKAGQHRGIAWAAPKPRSQAYRLLRKLFFISLSKGCSLAPPMRNARQVASTSITIRCISREVMGL